MAVAVHVAGACLVQVKFSGRSLIDLGYTRNMVDTTKEAFFLDVPCDENGGDDGPPIEVIYMGEIARIRCELTKWDTDAADEVRARISGNTAGTPNAAGHTMFANESTCEVNLNGASLDRHFPRCIVREAIEVGRSTKFSTFICEFTAYKSESGVLYDATLPTS